MEAGPPESLVNKLQQLMSKLMHESPDPGVANAVEWLAVKWKGFNLEPGFDVPQTAAVTNLPRRLRAPAGHKLVSFPERTQGFAMGETAANARETERVHRRRIGRSFAISKHEVTADQYQRFITDLLKKGIKVENNSRYSPNGSCPQTHVTWFEAAMYCRWLGELEGLPEEQQCYPPLDQIDQGMILPAGMLVRTGYRLPTEAEWEYACRGSTTTSRFYGAGESLLTRIRMVCWEFAGSPYPVGLLKPNAYGLFDMYGNASEWCHSRFLNYPTDDHHPVAMDKLDLFTETPGGNQTAIIRGGSFVHPGQELRSAGRLGEPPAARYLMYGFRIVRTLIWGQH